jgi:hypothetical protein
MANSNYVSTTALEAIVGSMPAKEAASFRAQHAWPVILDASAVIDDILYRTGPRGPSSALTVAMLVGVVRPLGKPDLVDEVARNLPGVAQREGRDLGTMQAMLEADYVPRLRLVDLAGIAFDHPGLARLAREDPSDESSARLNILLEPALLLTTDPDLLRNGFGLWQEDGAPVKWSYMAVTARDGGALVTTTAGMFSAVLGTGLVGLLVFEAFAAHPRISAAVAGGVVGILWAASESPRWSGEWKPTLTAGARRAMESFGDNVARYPEALTELGAYRTAHPGPGTPVARIARTLALGPDGGLLVSELREIHPDIGTVPAILDRYPAFVRTDRWRWTLGAAPGDER